MAIKFHQVVTLPTTLESDSFYFVANGSIAEAYLTDNAGLAKLMGNSTLINQLVDSKLADYQGGVVSDVPDIEARDLLSLDKNGLVMVFDASADAEVTAGSALYYYDKSADSFTLAAEYESLNIDFSWGNISGRPVSTPTQIDSSVSQAHSHSNKVSLDKIGESGAGKITYNGAEVSEPLQWDNNNW